MLRTFHHILQNLDRYLDRVGDYVYALHIPTLNQAWIGAQCSQVITYSSGQIVVSDLGSTKKIQVSPGNLWKQLRNLLDSESTYFFFVSLDLERTIQDPELPLIIFVKADVEISINGSSNQVNVLTHNQLNQNEIQVKLQNLLENQELSRIPKSPHSIHDEFSMSDWQGESDEYFLSRIISGIKILKKQKEPQSKMVICRSYSKPYSDRLRILDLYEKYTFMEPNCAASHYFKMPDKIISFGCSPENVFELVDKDLYMDVIASTRKRTTDLNEDEKLSQAFLNDRKEDEEHTMARNRSFRSFKELCMPSSVKLVKDKDTRALRHVSHLFSKYSGKLQDSLDYLDLLEQYFPPLTSYPSELVPLADDGREPNRFYGGMVGRVSAEPKREVRCFNNLRSGLMKNNTVHIRAGVGVIQHSNAESELLEVRHKLRCLIEALTLWENDDSYKQPDLLC